MAHDQRHENGSFAAESPPNGPCADLGQDLHEKL